MRDHFKIQNTKLHVSLPHRPLAFLSIKNEGCIWLQKQFALVIKMTVPEADERSISDVTDASTGIANGTKRDVPFKGKATIQIGVLFLLALLSLLTAKRNSHAPLLSSMQKPSASTAVATLPATASYKRPPMKIGSQEKPMLYSPRNRDGKALAWDDIHARQFQRKRQRSFHSYDVDPYVTAQPYDPFAPLSKPLKVPYPIFVLNLPKTGTTTIWQYFECGLGPNHAVHWWTNKNKRIGPCLDYNIRRDQPPLKRCGNFDVWIDCGYTSKGGGCFFPAVHGLKAFYQHYPNATLLLIQRDADSWFKSASKWGNMLENWSRSCRQSFFPNDTKRSDLNEDNFKNLYRRIINNIQQFAKEHPSMTYLEPPSGMTLSSPGIGAWLEEHVGIDAVCWGKCKPDGRTAVCENENKRQL